MSFSEKRGGKVIHNLFSFRNIKSAGIRNIWPIIIAVVAVSIVIYGVLISAAENVATASPPNSTWSTNGSISLFCDVKIDSDGNFGPDNLTNVSLWTNMSGAWARNATVSDMSNASPNIFNGTGNGVRVQFNLSGIGTARSQTFFWYCSVAANASHSSYNESVNISYKYFGVDKTAPTITLKNPLNGGYLNSSTAASWEVTLREHNKNATGASFYYRRGTSGSFQAFKTMSCMESVNGTYEDNYNCSIIVNLDSEVGVAEGDTIQFYINATDIVNNTGSSGTSSSPWSVTIDTVKPVLNDFNITPSNWVTGTASTTKLNLTFNVSDRYPGNCTLYTNTSGSLAANYTQSYTSNASTNFTVVDPNGFIIDAFGSGIYTFSISCNDSAANVITYQRNITIAIDTQAPNVTVSNPANNWKLNRRTVFVNFTPVDNMDLTNRISTYSGAAARSGNDSCELWTNFSSTWGIFSTTTGWDGFQNNGTRHNMTFNSTADGDYLWAVQCNDSAGNRKSSSNFTITFDTTSPTVSAINETFVDWNTMTTKNTILNFTVTANDANNDTCFVYHNLTGTMARNVSVDYSQNVNVSFPQINFSDAGSTVVNTTIECNDTAGNLGYFAANYTFTVDTQAPNVTLNGNHTNNGWISTRTYSFQFTPVDNMNNNTCELWTNMTGVFAANTSDTNFGVKGYVNNNSIHNFSTVTFTEDGVYDWSVRCNDTAGNYNVLPANGSVKIDTTSPVLIIPNPSNGSKFSSGASTLFQVNVTDANINKTYYGNTTVFFRRMGTSTWRNISLTCWGTSPTYTCNATNDTSPYIKNDETMEYYFSVTDSSGNSGTNGTATNPMTAIADTQPPSINASNSSQINWMTMGSNTLGIVFTATATDASPDKCFAYTNMTGAWAANTTSAVSFTSGSEATLPAITFTDGGVYKYAVACNDTGGNTNYSTSNYTFTIDVTPPTVALVAPGNNTFTNESVLSFQFYPTDNLNKTNDTTIGNQSCKLWSNLTGSWAENSTDTNFTGFVNGVTNHNVTLTVSETSDILWNVKCNDSVGNAGVSSVNYTVKADFADPVINSANASFDWRTMSSGTKSIVFNVNVSDSHENSCTLRHNASGSMANNMSVSFASNANTTIGPVNFSSDGVYSFAIACDDAAGRTNVTETRAFIIDTTAPTVSIVGPANNTFINESVVSFQFYPLDNFNSTNISTAGNQSCKFWSNFTGSWLENTTATNYSGFANGVSNHNVTLTFSNTTNLLWNVRCNDTAGNAGVSSVNYTLKVDFEDPVINSYNASFDWRTMSSGTKSIVFNVNVSDKNQNTCTLRHNASGSMANNMTVSFVSDANTTIGPVNFSDEGVYSFAFACDDAAGRTNVTQINAFSIDVSAPNVSIVGPANNTFINESVVSFQFYPSDNFNSTNISTAGNQSCKFWSNFTGSWLENTTATNYSGFANGVSNHNVTLTLSETSDILWNVRCNDSVGNAGVSSVNYTVKADFANPVINSINASPVNWNLMTAATRNITFSFNATDLRQNTCSVRTNASGSWANSITAPFTSNANSSAGPFNFTADGIYNFSVVCDDAAGRTTFSRNYTIAIDTAAPTVTTNYPTANYNTGNSPIAFKFTAIDAFNNSLVNDNATAGNNSCELWTNMTGAWALNKTMSFSNNNGTYMNFSAVTFTSGGAYKWGVSCNDTAGNVGASTNITVNIDSVAPSLINWTYNESSRLLVLGFDEIVNSNNVAPSSISINYSDGSNADGVTSLSGANATNVNSTSVFITLTIGQDSAIKQIQRNDPSQRINITLNGGAVKDLTGNNNNVNNSQPNKYYKAWHESPSWPSTISSRVTIPQTSTIRSWGWNETGVGSTQNWNISTVLSIGGLGSNYNIVYYNVDGTSSGWRYFLRSDWAGSTLQYVNNTNNNDYEINMTGTARFELCCRTLT